MQVYSCESSLSQIKHERTDLSTQSNSSSSPTLRLTQKRACSSSRIKWTCVMSILLSCVEARYFVYEQKDCNICPTNSYQKFQVNMLILHFISHLCFSKAGKNFLAYRLYIFLSRALYGCWYYA